MRIMKFLEEHAKVHNNRILLDLIEKSDIVKKMTIITTRSETNMWYDSGKCIVRLSDVNYVFKTTTVFDKCIMRLEPVDLTNVILSIGDENNGNNIMYEYDKIISMRIYTNKHDFTQRDSGAKILEYIQRSTKQNI